jgi:2',3'-cyclic-nucleotide 2'-phosphodiesterase (5'-nucleotidase family)
MIRKAAFVAASLATIANGAQPGAPTPVAAPMRDLEWGQINFLHTTDTHGWLGGHLQEYVKKSKLGYNVIC